MTVDEPSEIDPPTGAPAEPEQLAPPPDVAAEPAVPVAAAPVAAVPVAAPVAAAPVAAEPVAAPVAAAPAPGPVAVAPTAAPVVAPAKAPGLLKALSILVMIAGVILIGAGVVTWFVVRDQLNNEAITVSADAAHFAGDRVNGPLTAYAQADAIQQHTLKAGGGKTYAELPQDDPARDTVMTASFLRASLFTSVVSFGVAAFAAGIGLLMLIVGYILLRITKLFGVTTPASAAAGP